MDPENDAVDAPETMPAEDAAPSWATDALDVLIGDDYDEGDDQADDGVPADEAPEPPADDADPPVEGDGEEPAERDDTDAPQALKDLLKGKSRSERKVIWDHFESRANAKLAEAQAIADKAKADADARDAAVRDVREKQGRYVGEVEGQRPDGTPIPTYKEIERLLKARNGDDVLDEKYGMSRDEAIEQIEAWDERRAMLDGSLDQFRSDAWLEMGKMLAVSVAENGLDIDAVWKGVSNAKDVVTNVVKTLKAQHDREVAAIRKDYDSRLKAATANGTAVAAKNAARTLPTPESGGRGDASGDRIWKASEIAAMDSKEFARLESVLDKAEAEGRIVPG